MSNKKIIGFLAEPRDPENTLFGPDFDSVAELQNWMYGVSHHKHHPVTIKPEFLEVVLGEWEIFFPGLEFKDDFVTTDGTHWYAKIFKVNNVTYYLLFPKDRDKKRQDGTISSQSIALFYEGKERPKQSDIDRIAMLFLHLAIKDLRTFENSRKQS